MARSAPAPEADEAESIDVPVMPAETCLLIIDAAAAPSSAMLPPVTAAPAA